MSSNTGGTPGSAAAAIPTATRTFIDQTTKPNVRKFVACTDEPGRKQIKKRLLTADPWQAITQIQSAFSLGLPRSTDALNLVDNLHCPRSSVYASVFEKLKERLRSQIDQMQDDKLLAMLSAVRYNIYREYTL